MATVAPGSRSAIDRERVFFLKMAIAMAVVIVGGFSFNLAAGRSTFASPLVYHVHALVFFGWLVLYLLQNALVVTGSVQLHRRLGWLALAWIPAMVGLGVAMTLTSLRAIGGPPFLDANEFLFGNSLGIVAFAGLAIAAIVLRGRSDWHRRLMCAATASLTGPGFGRLLPMPLLIPWAWWMAAVVMPVAFTLVGVYFDRRRLGHVHRAWLWGIGALVASQVLADAIAYSPFGLSVTHGVLAGTPGAQRDLRAHFP